MAQTGQPTRAEVTDAAMAERAECVMLNKGPHVVQAVRALDDILGRMQGHQSKKSARLRRLRAWSPDAGADPIELAAPPPWPVSLEDSERSADPSGVSGG